MEGLNKWLIFWVATKYRKILLGVLINILNTNWILESDVVYLWTVKKYF